MRHSNGSLDQEPAHCQKSTNHWLLAHTLVLLCILEYGLLDNSNDIKPEDRESPAFHELINKCLVSSQLCLLWICAPLLGVTCVLVHCASEHRQVLHLALELHLALPLMVISLNTTLLCQVAQP